MALPAKNVYWKELPAGSCVIDRKIAFVARLPNGKHATIYWMGQESRQAQQTLVRLASKSCTTRPSKRRR